MVPPVTHVIVHKKPVNLTPWVHHVIPGWYIGPSLDHYRFMQCYMPATSIVRITGTLQFIPKLFAFQKTGTKYYLEQEIGYIIAIIKDLPNKIPFFSYGDAIKNAINHIAYILQ